MNSLECKAKIEHKRNRWVLQIGLLLIAAVASLVVGHAFADTGPNSLAGVAENITDSMSNVGKLISAGAYIAGMGFAVGAVMKFKAHKDNPQQIPIGTPIALIFIAAALIFLPNIFETTGETLFGSNAMKGGSTGSNQFTNYQGN